MQPSQKTLESRRFSSDGSRTPLWFNRVLDVTAGFLEARWPSPDQAALFLAGEPEPLCILDNAIAPARISFFLAALPEKEAKLAKSLLKSTLRDYLSDPHTGAPFFVIPALYDSGLASAVGTALTTFSRLAPGRADGPGTGEVREAEITLIRALSDANRRYRAIKATRQSLFEVDPLLELFALPRPVTDRAQFFAYVEGLFLTFYEGTGGAEARQRSRHPRLPRECYRSHASPITHLVALRNHERHLLTNHASLAREHLAAVNTLFARYCGTADPAGANFETGVRNLLAALAEFTVSVRAALPFSDMESGGLFGRGDLRPPTAAIEAVDAAGDPAARLREAYGRAAHEMEAGQAAYLDRLAAALDGAAVELARLVGERRDGLRDELLATVRRRLGKSAGSRELFDYDAFVFDELVTVAARRYDAARSLCIERLGDVAKSHGAGELDLHTVGVNHKAARAMLEASGVPAELPAEIASFVERLFAAPGGDAESAGVTSVLAWSQRLAKRVKKSVLARAERDLELDRRTLAEALAAAEAWLASPAGEPPQHPLARELLRAAGVTANARR